MAEFTGPSQHYLRQQTTAAMAALRPLQKLDSDSERQGLWAVIEACEARLKELPAPVASVVTVGAVLDGAGAGEMKASM